ncbi:MAG TPA: GNAT family N-acetyltransferase [Clostridia bacterium]
MQFETDRLIIRRFCCDDWKDLYEYLSQEKVVKYEPYDAYYTEKACKQEAINRSQNDAFWAVCLKESNKLIGNIYFQQQEPEEFLTWEIGYVFNPQYYGRGYATEACKRILQFGFEQVGAHRIIARCNPENTASWKLLERLSMRREGYYKKPVYFKKSPEGRPMWNDAYEYAILEEEWFFA